MRPAAPFDTGPVTGEEAKALVPRFGPDADEWHQRLHDRAVFGGLVARI